jgi:peptidoglycan hydrolase-like protein with peptidoglycan-binding domain
MSRHKKTFAPRANRSEAQTTDNKEEQEKYIPISSQDAKISLAKTEVTQITYDLFKNRAFNKVERGSSIIQFSDRGLHVSALNRALTELGYTAPENKTLFWNETKNGLINFQRKNSITPTGIFNKETLLKMNEALEASSNKEENKFPISERANMLYAAFEYRTLGIFTGTDEDKVFKALDKLSYEERYELIQYYDATYKPKRKVGLVRDLYKELGNKDLYKAIRLLYANYEEPQLELKPEPTHPEGELLEEVIITGEGSWIKPKTKYAIEGEPIEFECSYQYETPVMYAEGSKPKVPEVVRRVLIKKDDQVYDLFGYPLVKDVKTFRQDGAAISRFSINTHKSGAYTFVFIIENIITKEFRALTKEYQVKTLEEAAADDLNKNKIQNYSDFRQQVAFIEFNLSKGASKEQKSNPNFYIESASYSENPAKVSAADINHVPQSYYSIKGKPISKDDHYFWFAEINTPKEMFDGANALLGVEYAKNANIHGYKRGEYFGRDGWNMNSSQATAAFLGSLTGVYTIHCLVLDNDNIPTGQEASYRQVILPKDNYQALKNIKEYKKDIDKSFNTISPKTVLAINAVAINEETTETLSLNLFIGKSKKNPVNYVLTDLTPGVQHQHIYEGNSLEDVFEEFDSKNTYPDGILAYEIPSNVLGYPTLKGNFTTDGASFWESFSTGAGWASLGFAVAGLVATFTPAAPIAPFLFIAAGATGATSGTVSIIDKVQKGTVTNETLALDVIMIASSFLGMAGSLSSIVKASSIIKISATGMRYVILTDFVLNGTAAVMITSDGLESIQDIHDNKNLTTAEKIDAIVKILGQLTLTAGLLMLSSKNLKGGELEKLPKVKRQTTKQTSKKPYNPEQHNEFIDTPENLTGGKEPKTKNINKEEQIISKEKETHELYNYADKAYEVYSEILPEAINQLEKVAKGLGRISGRAKRPESALNRLQRALENGWVKEINNVDKAIDNIWDAVGTRIVLNDTTPQTIDAFVNNLCIAIESKEIEIIKVNNIFGNDGLPYLKEEHLSKIGKTVEKSYGKPIEISQKDYESGYTVATFYIKYTNNIKGELQLIGKKTLEIAEAEHWVYDTFLGKPYDDYIKLFSKQKDQDVVRLLIERIRQSAGELNITQKKLYNEYLNEVYKNARRVESNVPQHSLSLPKDISNNLSIENLLETERLIKGLKKGVIRTEDIINFLNIK